MLKAIVWENFVHFKDKNVISFNTCLNETTPQGAGSKTGTESKDTDAMIFNDLNIFVGANFCGKSTVLELIRRCMTDEINVSETKPFNAQEVAYAFCQFNLDSYDFVISGIIKESCNGAEYKVFIYKDQNGTFLRSKASDNSFTFNGLVHAAKDKIEINALLNTSANANIPNLLRLIKENKQRNRIVGWACRLFTAIKSRILTKNNGPSWKTIEEKYIATFPLRGIGSVQWTKSRKLGKKHKASNYKIACERAEVISTLLSEKHKHHIDEKNEKEIFRYITYPEVFTFKEDKGVIVVQHDSGSDVPLLKISEGIIEAKVTSLLLAHKDIQTLCLEEPDRGMHPQMIERLKKELYKAACSKTIIVVTHSPYLIDTITVNKTHVFVRELDKTTDSYVCSVKNVGENKDLKQVSNIEIRRTLLFATKVLIVEGPTDREVVQGIFTQITLNILKDGKKRKYWSENDLSAYQIISMNGCDNTESIQAFCDFINLPWLCLWDLDKVVVYDKKKTKDYIF